jgi:hypothetical protein
MTTEQDTMRAEFERWYDAHNMPAEANWFSLDSCGDYLDPHTLSAWQGYQAGRAAAQAAEPVAPGELPTTEAGWLHRCDQRFAEGYQKGRASAAQGAEPVAVVVGTNHLDGRVSWCKPGSLGLPLGTRLYAGQAPKAGEWMPIETTPTGRVHSPPLHAIVSSVLDDGSSYVEEAWYDYERQEWWPANVDHGDAHGAPVYPTHWMPLPAAPAAATKETNHG